MEVPPYEQEALRKAIVAGEMYGFGNVISHLRTAWAIKLRNQGFPVTGAHGSGILPEEMHRDIIYDGYWDETGERYRDDPLMKEWQAGSATEDEYRRRLQEEAEGKAKTPEPLRSAGTRSDPRSAP